MLISNFWVSFYLCHCSFFLNLLLSYVYYLKFINNWMERPWREACLDQVLDKLTFNSMHFPFDCYYFLLAKSILSPFSFWVLFDELAPFFFFYFCPRMSTSPAWYFLTVIAESGVCLCWWVFYICLLLGQSWFFQYSNGPNGTEPLQYDLEPF